MRWGHKRKRDLPREREDMGEVVEERGRRRVAAVHRHGLLELGLPVLLDDAYGVQIGVHHVGHLVRDVLQIVVVYDRDHRFPQST